MPYREASAASSDLVGAARVSGCGKFPYLILDAGNVWSKADLAMYAVVGFETVPRAPIGANEDRGDAGLHINTGNKNRASGEPIPRGLETG